MGSAEGMQGLTEMTPRVLLFVLARPQPRAALDCAIMLYRVKNHLEIDQTTINHRREVRGNIRRAVQLRISINRKR